MGPDSRLGLTRNIGNDAEGLIDRTWAYVENGKLQEYFQTAGGSDDTKVPARFHKEFKLTQEVA